MYSSINNVESTNKPNGQTFLSASNAQMIWDLLQETDIYNNINHQDKIEIKGQFTKNMRTFNDKHVASSIGLMERNKLFIGFLMNEYKKPPSTKMTSSFPTNKDVQEERRQLFEKDLQQKRAEFENMITLSKPETPVFSDKMDEPISRMDELISQTIASRELEINKIHNEMSSRPQEPVWLQETSIKSEKTFKQIKIKIDAERGKDEKGKDENEVIDLAPEPRNRVHFLEPMEDTPNTNTFEKPIEKSLENPLSKFKKMPANTNADAIVQLSLKMDELNGKLDYLITKLDGINYGLVPSDPSRRRGLSSTREV